MRLHKIIKIALCALVLVFVFCIGSFHGWTSREALAKRSGVYVYDTVQRLDTHYKMMRQSILGENLLPDDQEYAIDRFTRRLRPLVAMGRIAVFTDTINGDYLISETREGRFGLGILELAFLDPQESRSRSRLTFSSRTEEGWGASRFYGEFYYSEDDVYEKGGLFIYEKDGRSARAYYDTKGTGIFDEMRVYGSNIESLYRLNGLSWEKVSEREFHHPGLTGYKYIRSPHEPFGEHAENEKENVETEQNNSP